MSIIRSILSQHAEEAAFLWVKRTHLASQPHVGLTDLAKVDEQIAAHLDGLLIGGPAAWDVVEAKFQWLDAGEIFAAGCLSLENGEFARFDSLIEVGCSAKRLQSGLVAAMGWYSGNSWKDVATRLLNSAIGVERRVGIASHAARGENTNLNWDRLLSDDVPSVRVRALRAAGELGKINLLPAIRSAISDGDDSCRYWSAWSAARLSDRSEEVVQTLQEFAGRAGSFQESAIAMVLRILEISAANKWLLTLTASPRVFRLAAIGIGGLGDPRLVDALFPLMQINEVARVAGEAFTIITGVSLPDNHLEREIPAGFQSGPNDDPADENVAMDEDENLPWPDPAKLAAWWDKHRADFEPHTRYLCGKPLNEEWLNHVLRHGYQRQRAAAALELAIRSPSQPLFNVRAPARRQQQLLGLK